METDRQRLLYSYVLIFKLKKSTDYNPVLFDFEFYHFRCLSDKL